MKHGPGRLIEGAIALAVAVGLLKLFLDATTPRELPGVLTAFALWAGVYLLSELSAQAGKLLAGLDEALTLFQQLVRSIQSHEREPGR